jgi:hypothetical protein
MKNDVKRKMALQVRSDRAQSHVKSPRKILRALLDGLASQQ